VRVVVSGSCYEVKFQAESFRNGTELISNQPMWCTGICRLGSELHSCILFFIFRVCEKMLAGIMEISSGGLGCLALARWASWSAGQVGRHVKCCRREWNGGGGPGPVIREGELPRVPSYATAHGAGLPNQPGPVWRAQSAPGNQHSFDGVSVSLNLPMCFSFCKLLQNPCDLAFPFVTCWLRLWRNWSYNEHDQI